MSCPATSTGGTWPLSWTGCSRRTTAPSCSTPMDRSRTCCSGQAPERRRSGWPCHWTRTPGAVRSASAWQSWGVSPSMRSAMTSSSARPSTRSVISWDWTTASSTSSSFTMATRRTTPSRRRCSTAARTTGGRSTRMIAPGSPGSVRRPSSRQCPGRSAGGSSCRTARPVWRVSRWWRAGPTRRWSRPSAASRVSSSG